MALTPAAEAAIQQIETSETEDLVHAVRAIVAEVAKIVEQFGGSATVATAVDAALQQALAVGATVPARRTRALGDALARAFRVQADNTLIATSSRQGLMSATDKLRMEMLFAMGGGMGGSAGEERHYTLLAAGTPVAF
jgi:Rad3-related DNA helicase